MGGAKKTSDFARFFLALVAKYKDTDSTDVAENFVCSAGF